MQQCHVLLPLLPICYRYMHDIQQLQIEEDKIIIKKDKNVGNT